MGEPWRGSRSWAVVERAEAALGEPLAHLLLEAGDDVLARTREAQLAVFLQSLMAWEAVRADLADPDLDPPVAFAGHSLGQVTALVAAGSLSLEDGVRLAAARAAATQAAAEAAPGRLAALLGADLDLAEAACAAVEGAWVANDNAPGQVVIGGTPAGVEAAAGEARRLGARKVIPLNVGGAFHTPLMAPAAAALGPVLDGLRFRRPSAPVVSNVDGRPYGDAAGWPARLAAQLVSPVRWRDTLLTLAGLGARSLVEVGPGGVLAGLARRTVAGVPVRTVAIPDDVPLLMEVA
jgi:[acyl-carrier-protein] S-malonyltransferase